ncbi:FAD-dependent oxidoreductase [Citricoccus sp. GCM10030269]|uniref:FAD-dependent oxidoreductase n=1 Tax=Citricoccus sp. GCM10030269 TaxID=3273388 RepID=UPI0036189DC8
MPHPLTDVKIHTITKPRTAAVEELHGDLCVVGAGIAGMSAALTAAGLGRRVILVDALPMLGGQCANSLIGLFCGVYGNGPDYRQLTHGIFDRMFPALEQTQDLSYNHRHTITVNYDEHAVGRWMEQEVERAGVVPVTGASILEVENDAGHLRAVTFATRFGLLRVSADSFIDASGDAALTWESGLECRVPERTIWGSQQVRIEGLNPAAAPEPKELAQSVHDHAEDYGLIRRDGLAFFFPGRDTAVLNMTHIEAPLEAVGASEAQLRGKDQADRVIRFLKDQYPAAFGNATVRFYGLPGRRQTRWIAGEHQLTEHEVRSGFRFEDSIARTAWPIELHDQPEGYVWEQFDSDHVHYVPLGSITPRGAVNLLAAGRCVDGDAAALSSVRVMGPCAAMGEAAAHALDLADGGPVAEIDTAELRDRIRANIGPDRPQDGGGADNPDKPEHSENTEMVHAAH